MTFTINFGWWMLPTALTIALVVYGMKPSEPAYGYGRIGAGLVEGIVLLCGLVVVLIAWLIWALVA